MSKGKTTVSRPKKPGRPKAPSDEKTVETIYIPYYECGVERDIRFIKSEDYYRCYEDKNFLEKYIKSNGLGEIEDGYDFYLEDFISCVEVCKLEKFLASIETLIDLLAIDTDSISLLAVENFYSEEYPFLGIQVITKKSQKDIDREYQKYEENMVKYNLKLEEYHGRMLDYKKYVAKESKVKLRK